MTRRNLCSFALVLVFFAGIASGQGREAPTLAYKAVDVWPLPAPSAIGAPGPWNFGQVSGVAVNSNGNILVLHRGAHPILEFASSGEFLRSWGDGLFSEGKVFSVDPQHQVKGRTIHSGVYGPAGCDSCGAHSIRVDRQENIWVVDASGQVIYKMDQRGQVIMQLGTKGISGTGQRTFNLPTDIAFAPNGDIYVSDGYANERIVRFSPAGKYLMQWGTRGSGPGEFTLPHNLAIDAQGRVYVTDRENQRIQVFSPDGKFLKEWPGIGGISALVMTKDQTLWAGDGLFDLEGNLLGRLPGPSGGAHGLAVADSGDVYLAQLSGSVKKFVKD
jgi:DNA-binding beta-propeller fold protein YncE